jgi:hypothetical protein
MHPPYLYPASWCRDDGESLPFKTCKRVVKRKMDWYVEDKGVRCEGFGSMCEAVACYRLGTGDYVQGIRCLK